MADAKNNNRNIVTNGSENDTRHYSNNGKLSSMYNATSGETVTYTYDSLNRMATAAGSGWGEAYTLDPYGNLTTKTVTSGSGPSLSVSVNPGNNQLQGYGFNYDANGNAVNSSSATPLSYDAENRLTGVGWNNQAPAVDYCYDAQNKRIFLWTAGTVDSFNNVYNYTVVAYSPSGQKLGTYLFAPQQPDFQPGGINTPYITVSRVSSDQYFGGRRLAAMDQLGSAGTYYPWGEAKGTTNPQDTWSYATYWRDSATGLDYANNRYYSNVYGRFMTPDPYKAGARGANPRNPQSWNRYAYVTGDPVNTYDPQGLFGAPPDGSDPTPDDPPNQGPSPFEDLVNRRPTDGRTGMPPTNCRNDLGLKTAALLDIVAAVDQVMANSSLFSQQDISKFDDVLAQSIANGDAAFVGGHYQLGVKHNQLTDLASQVTDDPSFFTDLNNIFVAGTDGSASGALGLFSNGPRHELDGYLSGYSLHSHGIGNGNDLSFHIDDFNPYTDIAGLAGHFIVDVTRGRLGNMHGGATCLDPVFR